MKLLEIRQLHKTFAQRSRGDVRAVDGVSFAVEAGMLTILSGPSGSGKTTLLSLIGALDRPSSGEIVFDERKLSRCSDTALARVRREIGFVFQDFALLSRLSAIECITYPLIPRGIPREQRVASADALLDRLGIGHCRDTPTGRLSGGERQRVAVARALIVEPRLLLADEPTSNLDAESEEQLITVLQELHATGTTIVLATHDPRLLKLATNIIELRHGRIAHITGEVTSGE